MLFINIELGYELWEPIYLYNEKSVYEVSSHGRVRNTKTDKILKPRKHSSGYLNVNLHHNGNIRNYYIHRLVLLAFNPIYSDDILQVNHIDGDKKNNYLSNLEWCDNSYNQKHAYQIGLKRHIYGDMRPRANFTNDKILSMCRLMAAGYSNSYITELFNITDKELLSDIRCKRRWTQVTKDFDFEKLGKSRPGESNHFATHTEIDVRNVCESLVDGLSIKDIMKKYGYGKDFIWKIKSRKTWNHITKEYEY